MALNSHLSICHMSFGDSFLLCKGLNCNNAAPKLIQGPQEYWMIRYNLCPAHDGHYQGLI
jgi:hypothetical protein